MKAVFELKNFEQLSKLQDSIKVINEYLHNVATEYTMNLIKQEMPTSKPRKKNYKGQPKTYAKESDSLQTKNTNLGFIVMTTNPFYYLVFPALGVGNSVDKTPNDFMNRGINKAIPKIAQDLQENLKKEMEDKLK